MESTTFLSIALLICTIVYTIINYFMLLENQKARINAQKPEIIAYLKPTEVHDFFKLNIENIGVGVGYDLQIKVISEFFLYGDNDYPLSKLKIIENGLEIFPPKMKFKYSVYPTKKQEVLDLKFSLLFEYKDSLGNIYSKKINLMFDQISDETYSTPPESYIGRIAYYLQKIEGKIK